MYDIHKNLPTWIILGALKTFKNIQCILKNIRCLWISHFSVTKIWLIPDVVKKLSFGLRIWIPGLNPMRITMRFSNGSTDRSLVTVELSGTAIILATVVCRCSCHFNHPVNRISNDPQLTLVFCLQTVTLWKDEGSHNSLIEKH